MKIAIVHDWLTGMRGGEKCLEVFCSLFPQADLYTLIHVKGKLSPRIEAMRIRTSFLQYFPAVECNYRYFLPLMPWAIEQFDLRGYDLVLSSSHCVAKGVRVGERTLHLCYCYTPMRYIWDQYDQYFNPRYSGKITSLAMRWIAPALRRWDVRSSRSVDHFIAISRHVQRRIQAHYGRDSAVIYPPVDTQFFTPDQHEPRRDFFLIVSAFAPYKRIDLAVEAFNKLGYPLKIIGEGQGASHLRSIARSNIEFLGWLPDSEIRSYYARCRAFVFPGEEDFGITPLEAQSMGCPVIAFARGGAVETVIPDRETWKPELEIPAEAVSHPTGVFFHEPTADALSNAVEHFQSIVSRFDSPAIREHALKFDVSRFTENIRSFIEEQVRNHQC
jgi:glycosyltransferase involved in cell wall biosynthesis